MFRRYEIFQAARARVEAHNADPTKSYKIGINQVRTRLGADRDESEDLHFSSLT